MLEAFNDIKEILVSFKNLHSSGFTIILFIPLEEKGYANMSVKKGLVHC